MGRIGSKPICTEHHAAIERGDSWVHVWGPDEDHLLVGEALRAEQLVLADTINAELDHTYSPEFGRVQRLRIGGRVLGSGDVRGISLLLTPLVRDEIVSLARSLDPNNE